MQRSVSALSAHWRRAVTLRVPLGVSAATAAAVTSTGVSAVPVRSCVLATCQKRFSSSAATEQSAVNVEEFTLNEEVVRRDLETVARWNELSDSMEAARGRRDYEALLAVVSSGFALLEEVGGLNAPVQCEAMLCMEGAQAHCNLGHYEEALKLVKRAEAFLMTCKAEQRDMAQIAEVKQMQAYVLYKQGKAEESHAVYVEVLRWIDVDAKSAMPMQAVAAVNLRRLVLTGVGQSLALQAEQQALAEADSKEQFGKALDTLIEALNAHIDENDFHSVKSTLGSILTCFEGVGDVPQAVTTCRKYVNWCSRHNDDAGVAEGRRLMQELCERTGAENPLISEREGAGDGK